MVNYATKHSFLDAGCMTVIAGAAYLVPHHEEPVDVIEYLIRFHQRGYKKGVEQEQSVKHIGGLPLILLRKRSIIFSSL